MKGITDANIDGAGRRGRDEFDGTEWRRKKQRRVDKKKKKEEMIMMKMCVDNKKEII